MLPDFQRQRAQLPVGPDIQAVPTPLMAPPNSNGGAEAPALSAGTTAALGTLGGALGQKWGQHNDMSAAHGMYDTPMPQKRPPFQQLGPPMEVA